MRKLSFASVALALAGVCALVAPGCGSSTPDDGFDSGTGSGNGDGTGSGGEGGLGFGGGGTTDSGGGGGGLLDAACATATAKASRQPVYMLIVLDGSGSMGQQNKWVAIVPALDKIFDDIKTSNDTSFGIGLIAFSDQNDPTGGGGPYPSNKDIPIAFVDSTQAAALHKRIDNENPQGGTPTNTALSGGYKELEAFTPTGMLQPNGKKVLVLMTDGVPSDSTTKQDVTLVTSELTKGAPAGPITTFVVGVGNFPSGNTGNFDPSFLGQVAVAGGASPAGCNPTENTTLAKVCYFEVDPAGAASVAVLSQKFVDAINTIRGQLASCTFTLDKADGGAVDPTKVNVVFTNGAGMSSVVGNDMTNGWTYDDPNNPTSVTLHGMACDVVKADPKGAVSINIGCPTVKGPGVH